MKTIHPFPSISLSVPDEIREDTDDRVRSYWKVGESCLLQLSSYRREQGNQLSAAARLAERIQKGGTWTRIEIPNKPDGCDVASATTSDATGVSWTHLYLVWPEFSVYVTVSHEGTENDCKWIWDTIASIKPVVTYIPLGTP